MSDYPRALRRLLDFWRIEPSEPPRIHPADHAAGLELDGFELDLWPQPWLGDLVRARVCVLLLNPGHSSQERRLEQETPALRDALAQNLRGCEPVALLADAFRGHPGAARIGEVFKGVAPIEVLREHAALLHLIPYRSERLSAKQRELADRLPSAAAIREFAHSALVPAAARGEVAVVVARGARQWGFDADEGHENLIVYGRSEGGRAPVGAETRGGRAAKRALATLPASRSVGPAEIKPEPQPSAPRFASPGRGLFGRATPR